MQPSVKQNSLSFDYHQHSFNALGHIINSLFYVRNSLNIISILFIHKNL